MSRFGWCPSQTEKCSPDHLIVGDQMNSGKCALAIDLAVFREYGWMGAGEHVLGEEGVRLGVGIRLS